MNKVVYGCSIYKFPRRRTGCSYALEMEGGRRRRLILIRFIPSGLSSTGHRVPGVDLGNVVVLPIERNQASFYWEKKKWYNASRWIKSCHSFWHIFDRPMIAVIDICV